MLLEHGWNNDATTFCIRCLQQDFLASNSWLHSQFLILLAKTDRMQDLIDHVSISNDLDNE